MEQREIMQRLGEAMKKDKHDNPSWPDHPAGQAGRVAEPVGKLLSESMKLKYGRNINRAILIKKLQDETIATIVNSIRYLENLK